jgi:hypothetical protein
MNGTPPAHKTRGPAGRESRASKKWAAGSRQSAGKVWSNDLGVAAPPPPPAPAWMIELAEQVKLIEPGALLSVRLN